MTAPDAFESQARVVQALGACGGSGRAQLVMSGAAIPPDAFEAAVEQLCRAGRLQLATDGTLRFGPRGSALAAARVEELRAGGRYGHSVDVLPSVESTNDVVLERAGGGARPGLVVCAELQTAGRGRRGRSFDSQPGVGIWSTTLLDTPAEPEASPRLSLIAALALAAAVEAETGTRCDLKWPNDVSISGRKICGILVEARTAGGRMFPVAGIGVNVHHQLPDFPPELRETAGSLDAATGRTTDRSRFLAALLEKLESLVESDRAGGLDLPRAFAERDLLYDRDVTVLTASGEIHGRAAGVEDDGSLLLHVPRQGVHVVRSGEATLRPAAQT